MTGMIRQLGLKDMIIAGQDWGGPLIDLSHNLLSAETDDALAVPGYLLSVLGKGLGCTLHEPGSLSRTGSDKGGTLLDEQRTIEHWGTASTMPIRYD